MAALSLDSSVKAVSVVAGSDEAAAAAALANCTMIEDER